MKAAVLLLAAVCLLDGNDLWSPALSPLGRGLFESALSAAAQGRFKDALAHVGDLSTLADDTGDPVALAASHLAAASVFRGQGRSDEALAQLREVERLSKDLAFGTAVIDSILAQASLTRSPDDAARLYALAAALAGAEVEAPADAAGMLRHYATQIGRNRPDEAGALLRAAVTILERLDADSPSVRRDLAASLHQLGRLAARRGERAEAEAIWQRALGHAEATGDCAAFAALRADLAAKDFDTVDDEDLLKRYVRQERDACLVQRSDRESASDVRHDIRGLIAQAEAALRNGDLPGFEQYVLLTRSALGRVGAAEPETAVLAALDGELELRLRRSAAAEPLLRRAVSFNAPPPQYNRTFARAHRALAELLVRTGRLDAAESELRIALARYGSAGRSVTHLAACDRLLGEIALRRRALPKARSLFERSLRGLRQTGVPRDPEASLSLGGLARVAALQGDRGLALSLASEAATNSHRRWRRMLSTLNEPAALLAAPQWQEHIDLLVSFALEGKSAPELEPAWNAVMSTRAMVLEEITFRTRALESHPDPEVRRLTDTYRELTRTLELTVSGSGNTPDRIADVTGSRRLIEDALAVRISRLARSQHIATLREITPELGRTAALIAFLKFNRDDASDPGARTVPSYAAFVANGAGVATLRHLGSAADIEKAVVDWRRVLTAESREAFPGSSAAERAYRSAAVRLRQLIWDPLGDLLAGASRITIVPDGMLFQVSFASLPLASDRYLIEGGRDLHYLTAERELTRVGPYKHGRGLLVVGDPDFGLRTPGVRAGLPQCAAQTIFSQLPATRLEIAAVEAAFAAASSGPPLVTRLVERDATPANLRRHASGRAVVHVASHGFLLEPDCGQAEKIAQQPVRPFSRPENPLLLSGIALAGANRGGDGQNGILTAEQAATLDLNGVDWVVLSGCDTGLGRIQSGEGVHGLRRAFHQAGARTVIMSLWPVEDDAARRWMSALYRARFAHGAGTASAARIASVEVLRRRRAARQSTHPFYWAAFITSGDWR